MTETSQTPEVTVELHDEGPCEKRLRAEVPAESVTNELDSNYRQLVTTIQLPGFRKGRVPRTLLERRYASKIEADVQEDMVQTTFAEEVEKLNLKVLGNPSFDKIVFKAGEPLTFDAIFEVAPTFELTRYHGLEIEARPVEVSEEDVTNELESLREQTASLQPIALGEQGEGDIMQVDMVLAGTEAEPIEREDVYLKIGRDRVDNIVVDGLGERLSESGAEGTLEFEVKIPTEFPRADLRDRTVPLEIRVKKALRKILPELDEAFLRHFQTGSIEEFRDKLRASISTRRRIREEHRQEEELVERITAATEMELPPKFLERRKQELKMALELRLMREGKGQDEISQVLDEDSTAEQGARQELKEVFVLNRIAEEEKILVTEDEVDTRLQAIALAHNRPQEEVVEEYRNSGSLDELRSGLLREKVRTFLRKSAQLAGARDADASEAEDNEDDNEDHENKEP